jgi:hypothetical protein
MGKCKFWKKCPKYDKDSYVCEFTSGMYYEDSNSPAGCYRELEEIRKDKLWDIFFLTWGYLGAFALYYLYSRGIFTP